MKARLIVVSSQPSDRYDNSALTWLRLALCWLLVRVGAWIAGFAGVDFEI